MWQKLQLFYEGQDILNLSIFTQLIRLWLKLSRQKDRQLAAGLLSCPSKLCLPVLPGHHMTEAKGVAGLIMRSLTRQFLLCVLCLFEWNRK